MNTLKYLDVDLNSSTDVLYDRNELGPPLAVKNLCSLYSIEFDRKSFETLNIGNQFQLVTKLSDRIWNLLPIKSHKIIIPDEDFKSNIIKALHFLEKNSDEWNKLKKYLTGICLVQLKPSYKDKEFEITSLSVPVFPFVSFLSKKSQFHIPPSIINEKSSLYLAENLLHESVHQAVNINLLDKDILEEDYNSEESPLVNIPWRQNQGDARNKKWQIDRVLHAISVYVVISFFRRNILQKNKKEYSKDMFDESVKNAKYLMKNLLPYRKHFKNSQILDELQNDINTLET
ncbi:MAG: hypothetical protein OXC37_04425 [Bdellovibrionaceae bacterium]|nr:hypothetical protein [Pseudobdellovibrionaceae bacterium]